MEHDELEVKLHSIDEKVKLSARSRSNPELVLDYFPPFGNAEGYTSLELLLISLASCASTTMVTLIRGKMLKTIRSVEIIAGGNVKNTHPKAFSKITLSFKFFSPDVEDAEVQKALAVSEEKLCPVWAMIKGNVEVETSYEIIR